MDRAYGGKSREKEHTVRPSFFQALTCKRKDSTAQTVHPPEAITSNKRFKLPNMSRSKPSDSGSDTPLIVRFYDPNTQAKDTRGRTLEDILSWDDGELERCHNYIQMLFPLPEGSLFNFAAPVITREVMDEFRARSELRDNLRRSFERMLGFYGFQISSAPLEDEESKEDNVDSAEKMTDSTNQTEGNGQGNAVIQGSSETHQSFPTADSVDVLEAASKAKNNSHESTAPTPALSSNSQVSDPSPTGYYVTRAHHWQKSFRNWAVRFDHNHLRITRILRCLRVLGLQTECEAFHTALERVFDDPNIHINQRSMTFWKRATYRPLYIAPDDDRCAWLRKWVEEHPEEKQAAMEASETEGDSE